MAWIFISIIGVLFLLVGIGLWTLQPDIVCKILSAIATSVMFCLFAIVIWAMSQPKGSVTKPCFDRPKRKWDVLDERLRAIEARVEKLEK